MSGLLLAILILLIVPLLLGALWNRLWQSLHIAQAPEITGKNFPGTYLSGVFVMFCIFEAVVILSMKFDMPFSKVVMMVSVLFLVLCGISCVLCQRELKILLLPPDVKSATLQGIKAEKKVYFILLLLVFLAQILLVAHFAPVTGDDNTMEMIQTSITTDTIGAVNPLTGQPYETGLTLQGKLLNLPLFYAYFIRIFNADPAVFLYRLIPAWVLLMSYMACSTMGRGLFRKENGGSDSRRQLFLVCYGILLTFGGYLFTTPGYQLIHGAWKGETIVITVVIPYLLGCLLQLREKNIRAMAILRFLLASVTVIPLMPWRKGIVYLLCIVIIAGIIWICGKLRDFMVRNTKM
ncbi:MAG: DUF6077 domain-containing protein [Lachnospiraceae bacterium]|nr:DUF6077 domain-containing protein [Lachnospiraceae bacterium]